MAGKTVLKAVQHPFRLKTILILRQVKMAWHGNKWLGKVILKAVQQPYTRSGLRQFLMQEREKSSNNVYLLELLPSYPLRIPVAFPLVLLQLLHLRLVEAIEIVLQEI